MCIYIYPTQLGFLCPCHGIVSLPSVHHKIGGPVFFWRHPPVPAWQQRTKYASMSTSQDVTNSTTKIYWGIWVCLEIRYTVYSKMALGCFRGVHQMFNWVGQPWAWMKNCGFKPFWVDLNFNFFQLVHLFRSTSSSFSVKFRSIERWSSREFDFSRPLLACLGHL